MLRPMGKAYLFYSNRLNSGFVVFMLDFRVSFINNGVPIYLYLPMQGPACIARNILGSLFNAGGDCPGVGVYKWK